MHPVGSQSMWAKDFLDAGVNICERAAKHYLRLIRLEEEHLLPHLAGDIASMQRDIDSFEACNAKIASEMALIKTQIAAEETYMSMVEEREEEIIEAEVTLVVWRAFQDKKKAELARKRAECAAARARWSMLAEG